MEKISTLIYLQQIDTVFFEINK